MPDHPIGGTPGAPEDDGDEVDGVVLFDPTPRPPLEPPEGYEDRGGPRIVLLGLLAVALVAGGFLVYRGRTPEPAEPNPAPVATVTPPDSADLAPSFSPVGDGSLTAPAGSSVTLQVRASLPGGAPIADSLVQFGVTSGNATLTVDTARTDGEGVARAKLRLPPRVGRAVVGAVLVGSGLRTQITVTGLSGPPDRITITGGNDQTAEVTGLLPARPTVVVQDAVGNPVPDAEVRFTVVSGGGIVAPTRARTDSLGMATALWRLGAEAGTQELSAAASQLGTIVTFTANARGRPRIGDVPATAVESGPITVERRTFVIGGSHICVLSGGAAACRGANDRGQRGPGSSFGFVALATGINHTCGIDASGQAMCWGANEGGQLGDGSRTDRPSPVPVRTDLKFSLLTAGSAHTCGLSGGGVPVCWGQNLSGQLGDGTRTDARFPRAVGGGLQFKSLVAGWSHTCGLTQSGNAFCWGLNSDGQLGDGSRIDRLVPTLVRGAIESLTAGSAHTCGVSGRDVLCWGDNRFGELGDGTNTSQAQPVTVVGLSEPATDVVAGAVHTCALVADGSAYCWGQNLHGQLGDGTTQNRSTATAVAGGLHFRSLYAGGAMTCGITTDGAQYCWGLNQNGQLGDGSRTSRSTPTRVQ